MNNTSQDDSIQNSISEDQVSPSEIIEHLKTSNTTIWQALKDAWNTMPDNQKIRE